VVNPENGEQVEFEMAVAQLAQNRLVEDQRSAERAKRAKRAFWQRLGAYLLIVSLFVFTNYRIEHTIERVEEESQERALANCEASNESREGIRTFIETLFPDPRNESGQRIVSLAEEKFVTRDCVAELIDAPIGDD
jgi:hypothetical protein